MWRFKTDTKFKNSFFPGLIYWNHNRIHLNIWESWFGPPPSWGVAKTVQMTQETHWVVRPTWRWQNLKILCTRLTSSWSSLRKGAKRSGPNAVFVTWNLSQRKTWKATWLRNIQVMALIIWETSQKRLKPTIIKNVEKYSLPEMSWKLVFQMNCYKCQFCKGQFLVTKNLLDHMKLVTPSMDDVDGSYQTNSGSCGKQSAMPQV